MDPIICLRVDFNYGGRREDHGIVYLNYKSGDRSKMSSVHDEIFLSGGVVAAEGVPVLLSNPRSDLDENGTVCDMEVRGWLTWNEQFSTWMAVYPWNEMKWTPSTPLTNEES
jgi:hypothetical protein